MSKLQPLGAYVVFEKVSNEQSGGIIIPDTIGPTQALGKVVAVPTSDNFKAEYGALVEGVKFFFNPLKAIQLGKFYGILASEVVAVEIPE